ncbi:major facilitator superfamily domain-containing protein 8-like isoform X1 [Oculina patagonica]
MNLKTKKRSTRVCVGLFFLLGGIEYAVILPTLWLYLEHRFDAEQWFFGVVFASFCFSNLLSSPFFGFWVDFTRKTKSAILFANLFEIGGNFLYFIAWSKYWVLIARLIAGVGAGIGAGIFAQIARTTTDKERTGMYSIAMGLRQFGLLVGPGLNLFLKEFNVKLGPFKVDAYTSPGIFMAAVWLMLEVVILFFYYDLPAVKAVSDDEKSEEQNGYDYTVNGSVKENSFDKKALHGNTSINDAKLERSSDYIISSDANGDLTSTSEVIDSEKQKLINVNAPGFRRRSRTGSVMDKWHVAKDLVREEVVVILASQFMMFFNETAFEAIVTPLAEHLLGWHEIENSIAYCLIALEAILVFALVRKLSHKMADRWLMVIGIAFEGFALIWYLCLLANAKPYDKVVLPTIIIGTLVIVFGLPFFSVANISLYSKITDEKTQGIAQGIQRSVTGVAMILGPLWGGALTRRLYLMMGVMAALEVILAIMMFFSFDRLKEPQKQMPSQYDEIGTQNERQPLLA